MCTNIPQQSRPQNGILVLFKLMCPKERYRVEDIQNTVIPVNLNETNRLKFKIWYCELWEECQIKGQYIISSFCKLRYTYNLLLN